MEYQSRGIHWPFIRSFILHLRLRQNTADSHMGEIAAAYDSGLFTSREEVIIAYLRGNAVAANKRYGSMLAVGIGEDHFKMVTQNDLVDITVACYNSPDSFTPSGDMHEFWPSKKFSTKKGSLQDSCIPTGIINTPHTCVSWVCSMKSRC